MCTMMLNKTLEAGIPKEEVAFIHDADTEIQEKGTVFKSQENGTSSQSLLGSTTKNGCKELMFKTS